MTAIVFASDFLPMILQFAGNAGRQFLILKILLILSKNF